MDIKVVSKMNRYDLSHHDVVDVKDVRYLGYSKIVILMQNGIRPL